MTNKKQRGVKRSAKRLDNALGDALGAKSIQSMRRPQHPRKASGPNSDRARRSGRPNQPHLAKKSAPNTQSTGHSNALASASQPGNKRPKVPEALPLKSEKMSAVSRLTARVFKKPAIQEVVREPTAGGIVFRMSKDQKDIEILLIQDSKGRWTIPKGHIEPGENAKQTAIREIGEESGLYHIEVLMWLGKIHFQYRRIDKLVLMTTQIYLVRSLDAHETPTKEQWMKGIKWFRFNDARDAIEYEDIEKLMLLAKNKIRQGL